MLGDEAGPGRRIGSQRRVVRWRAWGVVERPSGHNDTSQRRSTSRTPATPAVHPPVSRVRQHGREPPTQPQAQPHNYKRARMTTSWTKLTTTDHAMRRASGRRHYNAERQWQAFFRLLDILKLVDQYGMGHGACQRIADELGVHRSTISRQLSPYRRAPRPKKPAITPSVDC